MPLSTNPPPRQSFLSLKKAFSLSLKTALCAHFHRQLFAEKVKVSFSYYCTNCLFDTFRVNMRFNVEIGKNRR